MRPGSVRALIVPAGLETPRVSSGPVTLASEDEDRSDWSGTVCRYRLEALAPGRATVRLGDAQWRVLVRGPVKPAEQTRDDTDDGWGEDGAGHSRTWWEEQRPPHW